jgi:uncharacterized MAPEG superfamily protein
VNAQPLMTIPVWMLLGFAAWTAFLLLSTIGVYRLSRVLRGRAGMADFPADRVEGDDWYRRSMRAHANCVENLPVFAAIVLALCAGEIKGSVVDGLSIAVLIARVMQSAVHIGLVQTNTVVTVRFTFFLIQLVSFLTLIFIVVQRALPIA